MSGIHLAPLVRGFVAPTGLVLLGCAGIWWAYPEDLPRWRAVAILTAWAGTGLLVGSLVLMVREPHWAALMGGLDTMYRWHHRAGIAAYVLLLAHPLALAMAGWQESPEIAWQSLAPWTQSWPVWLGWAALMLLMTGLAATLVLPLPYRRWRACHLGLGLGAVLGLSHFYVLLGGASLSAVPVAVGMLALGWRLIAGDLGLVSHPYRVRQVWSRAERTIEAELAPYATPLAVSPGQFVLAAFGNGAHYRGCGEFHPFTVSGIGRDGALRIAVKALGPCSQRIQQLEPGVVVRLQGPFGAFLRDAASVPQLWVAGGIGITPFMAALRQGSCVQPTTLIYLYRSAREAPFLDELGALAAANGKFELLARACGDVAPDIDALLACVSGVAEREVQLCGPPAMVDDWRARLRACGILAASIHFEHFDFR